MTSPRGIPDDQAEVLRALEGYYSAFSTLKVEAVLPFFLEPSLLMGPRGALAANTHSILATAMLTAMEALRSRGFGRTELRMGNVKPLGASAMLVEGIAQRYTVAGEELDRAGVAYVLHKTEPGWKIAVLIVLDDSGTRS